MRDVSFLDVPEWLYVRADRRWAEIVADVEKGKYPTDLELFRTLLYFGVAPGSKAARVVAHRIWKGIATLETGLPKYRRPRGNPGYKRGPRNGRNSDAELKAEYKIVLAELQQLKKATPNEYRKLTNASPSNHAMQVVADRNGLAVDTVRNAIRRKPVPT